MGIDANKIIVAYSGGLDTSVIIHWLKQQTNCEVVAFTADVGQGDELGGLEEKALATGASKLIIDDLKGPFVEDYVFPALRAAAVYESGYLLGTSLARPLIAERLVHHARAEGADAICHGATGKGNDQVRFELSAYALMPEVKVIAPWRTWAMKGRRDLIAYCEAHQIPIRVTEEKPYSIDRNLFHCSFEGGVLEDPWLAPDEGMFVLTQSPEKAPDTPEFVELEFREGQPKALDGHPLEPVELMTRLNDMAGRHGIGRIDIVENRFVGMKSRGVYETPGGTLLHVAHRGLEQVCLDREVLRLRDSLVPKYAELVYNGFWFAPERRALQVFMDEAQKGVSGHVRLKLYKGCATLLGRRSDQSLYDAELASFEAEDVYNQADAEGFIRLNALRLRVQAMRKG
ncbi:MAG: argininosuccinate synthase [Myxococcota bacterium]